MRCCSQPLRGIVLVLSETVLVLGFRGYSYSFGQYGVNRSSTMTDWTCVVCRSTTLLPRLIQRTATVIEDSVEYEHEYEYRSAEYEYEYEHDILALWLHLESSSRRLFIEHAGWRRIPRQAPWRHAEAWPRSPAAAAGEWHWAVIRPWSHRQRAWPHTRLA
jgi:hypothetical protein